MSYILDALKRLEQEKAVFRKGRDPMESLAEPDPVSGRSSRRGLVLWVGLGFLLAVGLTVGVTYRLARDSGPGATPQAPRLSSAGPAGSLTSRETAAGTSVRRDSRLSSKDTTAARDLRSSPADTAAARDLRSFPADTTAARDSRLSPTGTSAAVVFRPPPAERSGTSSSTTDAADGTVATGSGFFPTGTRSSATDYVVEPPPVSPSRGDRTSSAVPERQETPREAVEGLADWDRLPRVPYREAAPLEPVGKVYLNGTKDGIKISAIVWSREKKNRFAMINLKTVYEGDSYEGKGVLEIQQDGILFMEGNEQYKILLGGR